MKKKFLIFSVVVLLISFFYKILVRRNLNRGPINLAFLRPNGSYINVRTVLKEPGK